MDLPFAVSTPTFVLILCLPDRKLDNEMTAYQDGRWDVKKLRDDGYRTGSVLRVKMVSF